MVFRKLTKATKEQKQFLEANEFQNEFKQKQ